MKDFYGQRWVGPQSLFIMDWLHLLLRFSGGALSSSDVAWLESSMPLPDLNSRKTMIEA